MRFIFVLSVLVVGACGKEQSSGTVSSVISSNSSEEVGTKQVPPSTPPGLPSTSAGDTSQCSLRTDNSVDCKESKRVSPFTCVKFASDCSIHVQTENEGEFYELVSINGVNATRVAKYAKEGCQDGERNWKKRIAEDLDQVLSAACGELEDVAHVTVKKPDGTPHAFPSLSVNKDKRKATQACWEQHDSCSQ